MFCPALKIFFPCFFFLFHHEPVSTIRGPNPTSSHTHPTPSPAKAHFSSSLLLLWLLLLFKINFILISPETQDVWFLWTVFQVPGQVILVPNWNSSFWIYLTHASVSAMCVLPRKEKSVSPLHFSETWDATSNSTYTTCLLSVLLSYLFELTNP